MPGLFKNLVAAGITLSIADKETFVHKVAGLIEEYNADPAKAEKWADALARYAEELKDNIRLQTSIENSIEYAQMPKRDTIEQLTKAITALTEEMKKQYDKTD